MNKLLIPGLILLGGHFSFYQLTKFEKKITVKTKNNNNMIFTDEKNNEYKCKNCIWALPFSKKDNWNYLKEGNTYKIIGYGIKIERINIVPSMVHIHNTNEKKKILNFFNYFFIEDKKVLVIG